MPLSESYKILSGYREDQPTYSNPSRDVVMLPQISVSDGELSKLYSAFQGGDTNPVFPEWFHDVDSYCVRNLSLDEYQYYWMQYFTFFTPGLDYSSYQSSEFVKPAVESSEIRRIMLVLASSTPYINLDCFNNNDLLLQQMVSSLNVFSILLGKFYTVQQVGYYSQAYKWMTMGGGLINGTIIGVAQPVFAQIIAEKERQVQVFRKMVRFISFVAFPLMFGLALIAKELILITVTDKWEPCVPILRILCVWGAFAPICELYKNVVISHGRSNIYLWSNV